MRRQAPSFLLCLAATALAGCGGTGATKADVIARAGAICEAAARAVHLVPVPAGSASTSLPALARYTARVTPIVTSEVSRLQALPRPAQDRALLERYLAAIGRAAADYRQLDRAARAGDLTGVGAAEAALRASAAQDLAARYGLTGCARSG